MRREQSITLPNPLPDQVPKPGSKLSSSWQSQTYAEGHS
jgi:hypothetical protein